MNILLASLSLIRLSVAADAGPLLTDAPGVANFSTPTSASVTTESVDRLNWFQHPARPAFPTAIDTLLATALSTNDQLGSLLSRPAATQHSMAHQAVMDGHHAIRPSHHLTQPSGPRAGITAMSLKNRIEDMRPTTLDRRFDDEATQDRAHYSTS